MIYIVYVAVCLVGMTPKDCNHSNAVDWIAAPEPQQGLAACMIHGQEYVSQARLVIPGRCCNTSGRAPPSGARAGARVFPARTAPITPPRSKPVSPATPARQR